MQDNKTQYLRTVEDVKDSIITPYWNLINSNTDLIDNRVNAIIEVLRRIPDEDFEKFKDLSLNIECFLPKLYTYGSVIKSDVQVSSPDKNEDMITESPCSIVLYLSPVLEHLDSNIIIATAAHQIAHILHGHGHIDNDPITVSNEPQEHEVWETLRDWGFEKEAKKNLNHFGDIESTLNDCISIFAAD